MDDLEKKIMAALGQMSDDESRINAYVEQNMQKPMDDADDSDAKLFNTVFQREYPTLMGKANEALDVEKNKDEESSINMLESEGVVIGDVLNRSTTHGGRRRRRSATARKSSSYRHRRTSKKRGTQRKQKRRQRRGSRRAY